MRPLWGLVLLAVAVCLAKSPELRPDDNDPNVGGAGRDTTCPVPSSSQGAHAGFKYSDLSHNIVWISFAFFFIFLR
jgi:hypothetical protein